MLEFFVKFAPKCRNFLQLTGFLASRKKKEKKKKRSIPTYPKHFFGHVTGNMNLFFFLPKYSVTQKKFTSQKLEYQQRFDPNQHKH